MNPCFAIVNVKLSSLHILYAIRCSMVTEENALLTLREKNPN